MLNLKGMIKGWKQKKSKKIIEGRKNKRGVQKLKILQGHGH